MQGQPGAPGSIPAVSMLHTVIRPGGNDTNIPKLTYTQLLNAVKHLPDCAAFDQYQTRSQCRDPTVSTTRTALGSRGSPHRMDTFSQMERANCVSAPATCRGLHLCWTHRAQGAGLVQGGPGCGEQGCPTEEMLVLPPTFLLNVFSHQSSETSKRFII